VVKEMRIKREWKLKIKHIIEKLWEVAEIVGRAVLFVVIVLAIELCVAGLCYVACGR